MHLNGLKPCYENELHLTLKTLLCWTGL